MREFTQALIERSTLKEIREIAQSKGMKIYAVINDMLKAYKESQNETK